MITHPLKIYISSSWQGDLNEENQIIGPFIESELLFFPAMPRSAAPRDVTSNYFKIILECDFVIAILGSRYSSDVENEVRFANEHNLPTLCFIKDGNKEGELEALIIKIRETAVTKGFNNIDDLKNKVKEGVLTYLAETFRDHKTTEKAMIDLVKDGRIGMPPPLMQGTYIDVPKFNPFELKQFKSGSFS
jgi:hypothetical protein